MLLELATAAHAAGHGAHMDVHTLALVCWSAVHGLANLLVEGGLPLAFERDPQRLATTVVGALDGLLRVR
jgi:hypothetical protein